MRDIYRNPMFYYVLAPVLLGLWPLWVWASYLPSTNQALEKEQGQYWQALEFIEKIHKLDPDRANPVDGVSLGKFTYADAVDRAANLCSIPSGKCDLSSGRITSSGGKKVQQARVKLADVSIVQTANFLSRILSTWVNLTCDRVKLSKKDGMPDQWDVDLSFNYDY